MVLTDTSGGPPKDASTPNAAGAANASAQDGTFNDAPFFAQFGRRGRGWGGRGALLQEFFRPETVSLEGGEQGARGHHVPPPPPPGHHHPFWAGPHSPQPHPDPPLAPIPPVAPEPPAYGSDGGLDPAGLAGLFGQHARNFAGDLAGLFGAPPAADAHGRSGPAFGHHLGRGFGGGRGRGGWGAGAGAGGWGGRGWGGRGMRGGWGGGWPGHHPHPPHHEFVLPRMDIYKKENAFTVMVNLPGLKKQDVDISVTEGLLTISGEFPADKPTSGGGGGGEDPFAEYDIMDEEGEEVLMEGPSGNFDDNDGHYIRHERPSGKFKRSVRLPGWVNLDTIKATMAEGVLTLVIEKPAPESASSSTRKLKIA